MTENPGPTGTWRGRLGPHHFAFLRAVIEGLDAQDAARRYLGLEHGHQLRTLQQRLIDELRALARRQHDPRWRLIGVGLGESRNAHTAHAALTAAPTAVPTALPSPSALPSLDDWAQAQGLDGWAEAELLEMYLQAHVDPAAPTAPKIGTVATVAPSPSLSPSTAALRRQQRAARVRRLQLAALADLERTVATPARSSDPLDAWLEPKLAERLRTVGYLTLGDLRSAIALGARWWRGLKGFGPVKAQRVRSLLDRLLPASGSATGAAGPAGLVGIAGTTLPSPHAFTLPAAPGPHLDGSAGSNRAREPARIGANNDLQAIDAWIAARAGSPLTAKVYRREAERWLLWCALERGKALSSAGIDECVAYMEFLNQVPTTWMSRHKAARHQPGWRPFRTQPGLAARRLAVTVLRLLCEWLTHQARYLDSNPWAAVNTRRVDGQERPVDQTSRALSREAYSALLAALPDPLQPGLTRNGFVLAFARHTGLRASELLTATVGDIRRTEDGHVLHVVGKGRKARVVSLATPAVGVLQQYLRARGLPEVDRCAPEVPLLGAQGDPIRAPTYAAVHQSFKGFITRAVRKGALPPAEAERLARASQHWLRHTFATRWAEADGPIDVLQAELGHVSPATTARYYTAQQRRRQREAERIALAE